MVINIFVPNESRREKPFREARWYIVKVLVHDRGVKGKNLGY